jgi:hypothetical protein
MSPLGKAVIEMESSRCKMAAIGMDDPRGAGLLKAVAIEAEDSRCGSLAEGRMLEVEDPRCGSVRIAMEDHRCQSLYMKW